MGMDGHHRHTLQNRQINSWLEEQKQNSFLHQRKLSAFKVECQKVNIYTQAYTRKGSSPVQVLPVQNATPNSSVVCSCMYAFLLKWDLMRTPPFTGVRIGPNINRNAFMHKQITLDIYEEEVYRTHSKHEVNACFTDCTMH